MAISTVDCAVGFTSAPDEWASFMNTSLVYYYATYVEHERVAVDIVFWRMRGGNER